MVFLVISIFVYGITGSFNCLFRIAFYRDAMAFLVVFDLTNKETLKNVEWWLKEVKRNAYTTMPDLVLCGNKNDESRRDVTDYEIKRLVSAFG